MADAEMVLGVIGGVFGLLGAILAIVVGGIGAAFGMGSEILYLGFGAIMFSIIGIVGAVLDNKGHAAALMLIAGIGGFIMVSAAYIIGGPLLIIGGILAFRKRKK